MRLVSSQITFEGLFLLPQRAKLFNLLSQTDKLSPVDLRLLKFPQELLIRLLDDFAFLLPAAFCARNGGVCFGQRLGELIGDRLELRAQRGQYGSDLSQDGRVRKSFEGSRGYKGGIDRGSASTRSL